MIKRNEVTIIIPHFGATKEQCYSLNQCLKSLEETVPDIKIIVAKNGPSCYCRRDLRVLEQGQNKAVNAAVAITNTPWVFISNDDMIYAPGWFERLVEPLGKKYLYNPESLNETEFLYGPNRIILVNDVAAVKELKEILCISPMLVEPRGGAPTFREYFCGGAGGDFDKQKWLDFAADWAVPEDLRTGFNFPLLIRRDLWDLVGGYDINYDPWGSNGDSDLQYKIMLAGVQPYQNTNCIVYHFSQTSGTFEPKNDSFRFRNYAYFKEKWGFERTDNGIWESNFKMPTVEEGRIFTPEWEGKFK